MTKRERRYQKKQRQVALVVGSLLASLGASLGVIPDHALAETTGTDTTTTSSTASTSDATTAPTPTTTAAQQAEYQREAMLRGDGTRDLSAPAAMSKTPTIVPGPVASLLTRDDLSAENARRLALLNQGMTLADLDKADAALHDKAVAQAPNDPAAQQQILRQMMQARVVEYNLSVSSNPYDVILHTLQPNAVMSKISTATDLEVKKQVGMLQSGMTYQQVLDAEAQENATLQAQAAKQAPNDPAAQAQILKQLQHEQLIKDTVQFTPAAERYGVMLETVKDEMRGANPPLTALQLETEAVKRVSLMNSGLSYDQAASAQPTAAQQAEYQREAMLRGDGTRDLSAPAAMSKTPTIVPGPVASLLTRDDLSAENARRLALLNQGMTLADLDKADAALHDKAVAQAPNDPAAQQQILRQMMQARVVEYNLSVSSNPYDVILHTLQPNAVMSKISTATDLEVKKRVGMLQSGMTYQQVLDAEAQENATLQAQAAKQAPNDPAAQAQILKQLQHEQLIKDTVQFTPAAERYGVMLEVVKDEMRGANPPLTALQLETEAVKRVSLMNSGLSYDQAASAQPTAAQQAEYQREAMLRGDGTRDLSAPAAMSKTPTIVPGPVASLLTRDDLSAENARRLALLNQGMTMADLDQADAALHDKAVAQAPNDPAAQQQILRQMMQARVVEYNLSVSSNPYDVILHTLQPNAVMSKISTATDLEVKKQVGMLQSGMTYQQVLDAEAQENATLQAQAAKQAPNDPAAQAQILKQLQHEQLIQDIWQLTPSADRYELMLEIVKDEMRTANPPLTALQLETEAVKRMSLMNSGMSYVQVLAVAEADRQAMLAAAAAAAAAAAQQQAAMAAREAKQENVQLKPPPNRGGGSAQTNAVTTATDSAGTGNTTTTTGALSSGAGAVASGTPTTGTKIFICN